MFPIAADRLPISQIADFWASEIAPGDTKLRERREVDIRDLLVSAWWLGELVGTARRNRLSMLTSLYKTWNDEISFTLPGRYQRPIHKHLGGSRIWVTVPDVDPDNWTIDACETAFATLAQKWQRLRGNPEADPIIESTEPTDGYRVLAWEIESYEIIRDDFFLWAASKQFELPRFWGAIFSEHKEEGHQGTKLTAPVSFGSLINVAQAEISSNVSPNRRGRKPKVRIEVAAAMIADIELGRISEGELRNMKEEALASRYSVSRDTARAARITVLASTIVGNSISDK